MEAKYIISLCDYCPDDILEELLLLAEESRNDASDNKCFTEKCIMYLKSNISKNQLAILQYLDIVRSKDDANKEMIDEIILSEIQNILDITLECAINNKKHNIGHLLSVLPHLVITPNNEDVVKCSVFPKLHQLLLAGYQKEIFLSLLSQNGNTLTKLFTEYKIKHHAVEEFWEMDPNKMIDLCFGFTKHWLLEIISNSERLLSKEGGSQIHSTPFLNKVWQLVLINIINKCSENIDISSNLHVLENLLSILEYQHLEENLMLYINEIYRQLHLFKFCNNNAKRKVLFGWYDKVQTHSALSLLSQICDLSTLDRYKMKQALTLNNDLLNKLNNRHPAAKDSAQWDLMTYNAFCILTTIIDIILLNVDGSCDHDMTNKVDEVKVMISQLYPLTYRIEILQNIFSCLFLRYEHFCDEENTTNQYVASHSDSSYFIIKNMLSKQFTDNRGFLCNAALVHEILNVIKNSLNDILKFVSENKKSNVFIEKSVKKFQKTLSNAEYRWQLISNLNISTPPKLSSMSYLYNVTELSSDDEESQENSQHKIVKKVRTRKIRSKSVNEQYFKFKSSVIQDAGNDNKKNKSNDPDFISLMLSSPNTLLALCLESGEFSKAHRIVEIYDLVDTEGSIEVSYTERFLATASQIRNSVTYDDGNTTGSVDQIEYLTGISVISATVVSLVESFLSTTRAPYNYQITELAHAYPQLQLYDHRNSALISITDLLLSTGLDKNITYGILNVLEKKYHDLNVSIDVDSKQLNLLIFIKNIIKIFYDIYQDSDSTSNKFGICNILRTDKVSLRYKEYAIQKEFLNKLSSYCSDLAKKDNEGDDRESVLPSDEEKNLEFLLNILQFSGKDIFDISKIDLYDKCGETSYLKMFYKYLKSMTKLYNFNKLSVESIHEVDPNIFNVQVHDIVGDLIFKQNVSMDSVELICKQQGINFIHKIVLNCCPSVETGYKVTKEDKEEFIKLFEVVLQPRATFAEEDLTYKNLDISNACCKPTKPVINYILIHNWVIANLVKKIHSDLSEHIFQQSMDTRTMLLDLYLQLPKFQILKSMFYDNVPLTALQTQINLSLLSKYFTSLLKRGKLYECLEVMNALPEHQIFSTSYIRDLKDQLLLKLSVQDDNENNWKYFLRISNKELQLEHLFNNLVNWTSTGAIAVMEYVLHNEDFHLGELEEVCKDWLASIPVYEKISHFSHGNTWAAIHSMSNEDPESVLQVLMDAQQFGLCLSWANIHKVSTNMKNLIIQNLLKQILESSSDLSKDEFSTFIETLPSQQTITLCEEMLLTIRNLPVLGIVLNFLLTHSCDVNQYENIRVGTELMCEMDVPERAYFWEIINKPLLIIEQYLMNAKLDKLEKLLLKIKPSLKADSLGDNLFYNISQINSLIISTNAVDSLLRYYSARALDLKSTKRLSQVFTKPDEMFHQSIDSINIVGESNTFIMPEEVPQREHWVPDNFTDKCMSCKTTIFSVLIRRHHCRRCGRLVCYSCSRNRLQIAGLYDDIKVRVCIDCYNQTMSKSDMKYAKSMTQPGSSSGYSDHMSMEWCLTADPKHNTQLRKEFVYEFSPNVTLCLSIMKMHTINYDYPRFLLDRSDELSSAASNDGASASARELLKMRRALLLWCTVLYSRPMSSELNNQQHSLTETALTHTQRQMTVTDALTLLFRQGCYHMIQNQNIIDYHCVRRLLEAEKWDVALEISTKFGMPRYGVLAAWGKACLKAGCFQQARQKFALCFKTSISNTPSQIFDDVEIKEAPSNKTIVRLKKMEHSMSSSHLDLPRVRSNPSLLAEIISLLENISYPLNQQILTTADTLKSSFEKFTFSSKKNKKVVTPEPALNVMHALASVNKLKCGDFSDFSTTHLYSTKPKVTGLLKKQQNNTEKCLLKRKMEAFFYNECIYYLTTYGSHGAIIEFYFKYGSTQEALQYCLDNSVDKEAFTDNIFVSCLKTNKVNDLLKAMNDIDNTWNVWTDYILHVCRVLERSGNLLALHSIQSGVGDHVRAAMTCAALYTQPTQPPHAAALMKRAHHLAEAKGHLQHVPRKLNKDKINKESPTKSLHLKLDGPALDTHINTICRQLEVAKFLYTCEIDNRLNDEMVQMIVSPIGEESSRTNDCFLPTLFDSHMQKMKLAVLLIACAPTIDQGFTIASKIVEEHFLEPLKVYQQAARYLVSVERYEHVVQLCECIKKSTTNNAESTTEGVVELSVGAIVRKCDSKGILFDELAELLIQKVDNIAVKISCYIECRLLKTAYGLALKSNRMGDLKKIMREAERLGQTQVKNACVKRLKTVQ